MASTITLQDTATWAQGFLFSQPLALGAANEPAITIANIVKQAILGPPFAWRWNRKLPASFPLTFASDSFTQALADFGFLEKAWVTESASGLMKEVEEIAEVLPRAAVQGRPDKAVSAVTDDNVGDITFIVAPAPNLSTYSLNLCYQMKATLFTALANTWAPIPDELSYIYQYGFLGLALAFNRDPRAQIYDARFISHLLGCQGGLSEMQKNIFLGKWLTTGLEVGTANARAQQGVQGRAQ